jgi:nitric oxide reductase activation protein
MQTEKDFLQKQKLWIRETAPERKDYRFWHLVDLSNSMAGEKIEETFKGFIVVGEAIDRLENLNSDTLNIRQGITGFHNKIFPFKEPNERFTKQVEDKLSGMPERTYDRDAGTNTYSATIFALEALKQVRGETGNFLLTFSDGEPNYDIRDQLKKLLKEGKEERKRLKIKVGLIWLGEEEDQEKLQELVKEYGYDFGLVMPAVRPEKGKNFSEALAELLEDIVKNPEKY